MMYGREIIPLNAEKLEVFFYEVQNIRGADFCLSNFGYTEFVLFSTYHLCSSW